jgi:hypothetical protein
MSRFALLLVCLSLLCADAVHAQTAETYPQFRVGGFADLELHTSSDGTREGVDIAEIDIYPTVQLSENWSALAETVARHDWRSTDRGRELIAEFALERLYVAYAPSDAFRMEIGQTHTGIVRWNEREHRSRLLQTPIDVPAIARRPQEDGAWPLRFIGVWISGRSNDAAGFGYGIGVGRGPGRDRDSISVFGGNGSLATGGSVSFEPPRWRGIEIAAAFYAQRIPTADPLRERDGTLSLNYNRGGAEVHAEWARMVHTSDRTELRYRSTGYYVLASHRLSGRAAAFRPYLLFDRLNIAPGEELLRDSASENAWATGVRWDVARRITVKGEYRSQRGLEHDRESVLGLQLGLSF